MSYLLAGEPEWCICQALLTCRRYSCSRVYIWKPSEIYRAIIVLLAITCAGRATRSAFWLIVAEAALGYVRKLEKIGR